MPGRPFSPMEPVRWASPFNSPHWVFQPKWDGVRLLAHLDGSDVRLFSKRGHERTSLYPELVAELSQRFQGRQAIFDAEAVVFTQDRPSFPRIMQRELAGNPWVIQAYVTALPVTYLVFDLLYLDGKEVIERPFIERQELLRNALESRESVVLTPGFPGHGLALFTAVRERGWEGVVAKLATSPYVPGGKSPYWRKVKVRLEQLCAVGGFTITSRGLGSLLLGAYQDGALRYIGRASSGLTETERETLADYLASTVRPDSPFTLPPHLPGLQVRWVEPTQAVRVEFAEWTEELRLRHPVIRSFPDLPLSECRLP